MKRYLTVTETARICGVKPGTVRRWIALGHITRTKTGHIDAADLIRWWDRRDTRKVALAFRRWERIAFSERAAMPKTRTPEPP